MTVPSNPAPHGDAEVLRLLVEIKSEVSNVRMELAAHKIEVIRAFLKDEDGFPDFDGHKRDHAARRDSAKAIDSYKAEAARKVVTMATGGGLLVLALAMWEYFKRQIGA